MIILRYKVREDRKRLGMGLGVKLLRVIHWESLWHQIMKRRGREVNRWTDGRAEQCLDAKD